MRRFPLVLPALAMGAGVAVGCVLTPFFAYLALVIVLLLSRVLLAARGFWVFLLASFFFLGSFLMAREAPRTNGLLFSKNGGAAALRGVVLDDIRKEQKGRRCALKFPFRVKTRGRSEIVRVTLINPRGVIYAGDELFVIGTLRYAEKRRPRAGRPAPYFLGIGRHSYLLVSEGNGVLGMLSPMRRFLLKRFDDLLPDPEAPVLKTMILGARTEVSRELNREFSNLGIVHILSVSGFHMSVIGLFLYFFGRLFLVGPRFSVGCALAGLALYYFLSGQAPPSFRSLIMAFAFLFGKLMGRGGNGLNALALAFMAALFIQPSELFGISFQLSYLVVLGLVIDFMFVRPERGRRRDAGILGWIVRHGLGLVRISAIAFFFSLGLVAYYFGLLSPVSILLNAVLSPLFTLIIILGFLMCPAAFSGDLIGGLFSLFAYCPTHLLLGLTAALSKIPWIACRGPKLNLAGLVFYYSALAAVYAGLYYRRSILAWIYEQRLQRIKLLK